MKAFLPIILLLAVILFVNEIKAQDEPKKGYIYNSVVGNNSEPIIYNSVNLNTYELLTTNLQVSKEDDLAKIVFAPLKLIDPEKVGFLRETRLNLAQKNDISTIGIGIGFDNSSPFCKRADRIFEKVTFKTLEPPKPGQTDYDYEFYKSNFYYGLDTTYAKAYKSLLENSFKVTLGYNLSLFKIIGGDLVDINNDSIIDNYYKIESNNLSLGLTYIYTIKTAFNLTAHFNSKYASPKENEKKVDYIGGSLSFAQQIFVLNKDYKKTKDYLKSLFIPSIVLGVSLEYQKAINNKSFAKDGIDESFAITPFSEFKINPKNQFRIGVPIINYSGINKEIAFGPFIQWTLQIAKVE